MVENSIKKLIYKSGENQNFYVAINPNVEVSEQGYVWFNSSEHERDNAYPNKLIDYYRNASSVHANMINLKASLTFGSGLKPKDKNDIKVQQFIRTANRAGETLNDIYKKMSFDFSLFEAAALQVIYNDFGEVVEVYHVCPSFIRAKTPNEYGFVEEYLLNDDWGIVSNKRKYRPSNMVANSQALPAFNPEFGSKDKKQILYIKKYTSGHDVYACVSYNACLNYVELDYQLSKFHLMKVSNGFNPSSIITLIGSPDEESKDKFIANFKRNHTGADNVGNQLFQWVDGPEDKPTIERLEGEPNDNLYNNLDDIVTAKICTAHQASPDLAGITTAGPSLGGDANKITVARASFIQSVIVDFQSTLLAGLNKIMSVNKLTELDVTNEPLRLTQPVLDPTDTTSDERRDILLGFPPLNAKLDSTGTVIPQSGSTETSTTPAVLNESLAGMTGKQSQNLMRIIRQISQGKLTKEAGMSLLKASFGFTDELIASLLMDDEIAEEKIQSPNPVPIPA